MENGQGESGHQQIDGNTEAYAKANEERKPLKLQSPGAGDSLIFQFNQPETNHLNALDILDLIRSVLSEYPEIDTIIRNHCRLEEVDVYNYSVIRSLCKKFNKAVHQMLKNSTNGPETVRSAMNKDLLRQVVTRCYNKAVDNEKALNKHYEAFSSQTYGETSYDRMQMIMDEIHPGAEDVFVDLGSGVGQLVVHVAGAASVKKAVGIEIAQLPSRFANSLESEFKRYMSWYGKACSPFQLDQGDFLDEKYRELITQEATIIFINNYAFQSDLETRIKMELLRELKDGTRIITTKPYVPLNKGGVITDRQMNDISVIIDIVELKQCPNPCSWTSAYVPYYMHVINRAKLERYFLNRNPALRGRSNDSRRSSTPSSTKTSNSRESSVGLKETSYKNGHKMTNGGSANTNDELGFGPTTRRKWQEYVSELDQQKRKKGGMNDSGDSTPTASKLAVDSPRSGFSADVFSDGKDDEDSEDSIPVKKKSRRSVEKKKDKSQRGRPRKSDGKNSSMSVDAKEGIELMHQMTKAVSTGGTADPALILADLTNHHRPKSALASASYSGSGKDSTAEHISLQQDNSVFHDPLQPSSSTSTARLLAFPFPNIRADDPMKSKAPSSLWKDLGAARTRADVPAKTVGADFSSTKYPSLNKFLTELRFLYENFLDSMHTPEFVRSLKDKINSEKARKETCVDNNLVRAADGTPIKQETNAVASEWPPHAEELLPQDRVSDFISSSGNAQKCTNFSRSNGNTAPNLAGFAERAQKLAQMHRQIYTKWKELDEDVAKYHAEMEQFSSDCQRMEENYYEEEQQRTAQFNEQQQREEIGQQQQLLLSQQQQQYQQQKQLLISVARQQILQQQHRPAASQQHQSNSLFPTASGIEQLVLSDLVHHYSQQPQQQIHQHSQSQNTSPLLSQLGSLLGVSSSHLSKISAPLQPLASSNAIEMNALQAAISATAASIGSGGCVQSVGDHHQASISAKLSPVLTSAAPPPREIAASTGVGSSDMTAALAALSVPQPQVQHQISTQQQQLMQTILNSINLNIGTKTANVAADNFFSSSNESGVQNFFDSSHEANVLKSSNEGTFSQQQRQQTPTNYNSKLNDLLAAAAAMSPTFGSNINDNFNAASQLQHEAAISMESNMTLPSTSACHAMAYSSHLLDEQSTVAAVVAAVAAGATKKSRSKSSRSSNGSKRSSHGSKQTPEDPEKQEEIERQIQLSDSELRSTDEVIVAKALEVDHVAKHAEKERKARSFEKRRDKCSASLSIATPNFAGASANIAANCTVLGSTKKRSSSEFFAATSASNSYELLSPISTNAANSSFGGSASGSAVSSPVALIGGNQQHFTSSAASACAQLLSSGTTGAGSGSALASPVSTKYPISIVSVAPPPHSPPMRPVSPSSPLPLGALGEMTFGKVSSSVYAQDFSDAEGLTQSGFTAALRSSAGTLPANSTTAVYSGSIGTTSFNSSATSILLNANTLSQSSAQLTLNASTNDASNLLRQSTHENLFPLTINTENVSTDTPRKLPKRGAFNVGESSKSPSVSRSALSNNDSTSQSATISMSLSSGQKISKSISASSTSPRATTAYVPLSKRTLIEDVQFALPPVSSSSTTPTRSSLKHSRHFSSSIKTEKRLYDDRPSSQKHKQHPTRH